MRFATICIVVSLAFAIIAVAIKATPEPKLVEPEPQSWRNYEVGKLDVFEWTDEWGRVCTAISMDMQSDVAVDCDYPQRNTPYDAPR